MVIIVVTIQADGKAVELNYDSVSKRSEESEFEREIAQMYVVAAKACEVALAKAISKDATLAEGKKGTVTAQELREIAVNILEKEALKPIIKRLLDEGFILPERTRPL